MKRSIALLCVLALAATPSYAKRKNLLSELETVVHDAMQPGAVTVPATGQIEVAFSPNEGAEQLVVKTIDSATSSIRMLAYNFTSAPVVAALVRAKKRNVDVAIVVDHESNITNDRSGKAKAALGTLVTAGVAVRTIDVYAIAHDKSIVVDGKHVETGSYNYSSSAEHRNSENVIVHLNNPQLAAVYLKHWERNWKQGQDYRPGF